MRKTKKKPAWNDFSTRGKYFVMGLYEGDSFVNLLVERHSDFMSAKKALPDISLKRPIIFVVKTVFFEHSIVKEFYLNGFIKRMWTK